MQIVKINDREYLKLNDDEKPLVRENLISKSQLQNELKEMSKQIDRIQDELQNWRDDKDRVQECLLMFK